MTGPVRSFCWSGLKEVSSWLSGVGLEEVGVDPVLTGEEVDLGVGVPALLGEVRLGLRPGEVGREGSGEDEG